MPWQELQALTRHLRGEGVRQEQRPSFLRRVAWFTLWQAVLSTILTLVAGLPAAYVVARYDIDRLVADVDALYRDLLA